MYSQLKDCDNLTWEYLFKLYVAQIKRVSKESSLDGLFRLHDAVDVIVLVCCLLHNGQYWQPEDALKHATGDP